MHLKIKVNETLPIESTKMLRLKYKYEDDNLLNGYQTDSGLDLLIPEKITVPRKSTGFKIKLGIKCEPIFEDGKPRGFYLYPRSSTGSKTPLRLSNSVGIIDFTYRGELMACVDNVSDTDFVIEMGQRLFQICSPDLSPISTELCDVLSETQRGAGGYGSTGV